jgi:glucose-6-phosphate dehydrogenase assembly protein OpcA
MMARRQRPRSSVAAVNPFAADLERLAAAMEDRARYHEELAARWRALRASLLSTPPADNIPEANLLYVDDSAVSADAGPAS